jgi:hypothetical protein
MAETWSQFQRSCDRGRTAVGMAWLRWGRLPAAGTSDGAAVRRSHFALCASYARAQLTLSMNSICSNEMHGRNSLCLRIVSAPADFMGALTLSKNSIRHGRTHIVQE